MTFRRLLTLVVGLCLVGAVPVAHAVIVPGQKGRNLSPPTGKLAGSGWQYEGDWGDFLGTAIAPHFFLTAKHVGGTIGQVFRYRDRLYTTVERIASPSTDLAVWRVEETLPDWAPLFTSSDEVGRSVVVVGRGTDRGTPLYRNGQLRGWYWGAQDHAWSWGTNTVVGVTDGFLGRRPTSPSTPADDKLVFTFDARDGDANTCQISTGDSGGGVFTQVGKDWQLVGVVWGMESGFSLTADGVGFAAALFDSRGLYFAPGGPKRGMVPEGDTPNPGVWYATRVASNQVFLRRALATGSRPPPFRTVPARLLRFAGFTALGAVIGVLIAALQRRWRAAGATG